MEVRSAQKNESLLLLPNFGGGTSGVDDEGRWLGWVAGCCPAGGFGLGVLFLCFCSCNDLYG